MKLKFKAGLDGHLDEKQFLYLVEAYCERIQHDDSLEPYFGDFDKKRLMSLQQEFLFAAFLRGGRSCRLNICEIFEKGISDDEFDALVEHFHEALSASSVTVDVFDICQLYLHETRQGCQSNEGMDLGYCPMCVLRSPVEADSLDNKKRRGIRSVFRKLRAQS